MKVRVINEATFNTTLSLVGYRTLKPIVFSSSAFEKKEEKKKRDMAILPIHVGTNRNISASFTFPTHSPFYELEMIAFENLPNNVSLNIRYGKTGDEFFTGEVNVGSPLYTRRKVIDFRKLYGLCPKFKKEDVVVVNILFTDAKLPKKLLIYFLYSFP